MIGRPARQYWRHGAADESALREAAMRYYPEEETIVLPLLAAGGSLGVMIVRPRAPGARLHARQARLLGNCAKQVAGALGCRNVGHRGR